TSPEVHPAFGALVARQALEVWERLGRPVPFVVEEWGAGSGRLAADLLEVARDLAPGFASSLRYVIVERSATLRRAQRQLLRPWAGDGSVLWSRARNPAVSTAKSVAAHMGRLAPDPSQLAPHLVLANELLDAFAVHRVVRRGEALRELYVDVAGDAF